MTPRSQQYVPFAEQPVDPSRRKLFELAAALGFASVMPGMWWQNAEAAPSTGRPAATGNWIFCVNRNADDGSTGGVIHTLEGGENRTVEAMGVSQGVIVATGSLQHVSALMPQDSTVRRLSGKQAIIPGLVEPHVHLLHTAVANLFVDVSPFDRQRLRSRYDRAWVLDELRRAEARIGPWMLGRGVDPSLFPLDDAHLFDATTLRQVSTTAPVFVLNASMHFAYINEVALAIVRQHGIDVGDDGIVSEPARIIAVLNVIKASSAPDTLARQLDQSLDRLLASASAMGVTFMFDALIDPWSRKAGTLNEADYLAKKAASEHCPVRMGCALAVYHPDHFESRIDGYYTPGQGDDNFRISAIKIVADGSTQGMTGYLYEPYRCDKRYRPLDAETARRQNNVGLFNFGYPMAFDAVVDKAVRRNWPVMIHANGDHAASRAILALKRAEVDRRAKGPLRHRIEHASLLSDQNLQDMAALGVSPSFLIGHVGYWGWRLQQTILGPARADLLDRCRSALDLGIRISLHSDHGVTPLGPLRQMEQAIGRKMEGAPAGTGTPVLNARECITRFDALKAVTYDAAWQCQADHIVGSLVAGKLADFVLLAESPLSYRGAGSLDSVEGMRDIQVLETWQGGRQVYAAPTP